MDPFITFRRFPEKIAAREFGALLESKGIRYEIENNSPRVDVTFVGSPLQKQYILKLHKDDLQAARQLLEEEATEMMQAIDKDYYLFEFSNEELHDVLKKPDEWNEFDYLLAQKILQERGEAIDEGYVEQLEAERLSELKAQKDAAPWLILLGYVLALAGGIFAIVAAIMQVKPIPDYVLLGYILGAIGGVFAVMVGWILLTSRMSLPDGSRQALFGKKTQNNGRWIFLLGLLTSIALAILIWNYAFGEG